MRTKAILPLALVAVVLISSGCINTSVLSGNRPEDVVKSLTEVQEFMSTHPDSELSVTYRSEGYIRSAISEISDRCGPYFKIIDHWEVVFSDPFTDNALTVWLEKDTRQLACLYGEGIDSPPPILPPAPPKELFTVTGLSGIDVNKGKSDFSNGELTLVLRNPNPERITIKKVTASYLDDVLENISNSGLLNQGDSFTYTFDFSRTIEDGTLWIYLDVLYDLPDSSIANERSRGALISGFDTDWIIQCGTAGFEVNSYNFYFGTRVFSVNLENTGSIDLNLKAFFRNETGELEEAADVFELKYKESKPLELEGLNRIMESVIIVSEACPGAQAVIFVENIPGV